jgi:N-methylhydantoinase B
MHELDPVTLELIRNSLLSVCEEMSQALVRSSHSPSIKERKDCSCGIYTADGEMAVQAEHIPIHLGVMPFAMRAILARYPRDEMRPGDTFLVNDPYHGANHLPDFILAGPLFIEGELVGFAASLAHHNDVGGMAARSMPAAAREIFQEGLRIPPVRLTRDWQPDEAMTRLIVSNSRTPDERLADLRAQIAVAKLAQQRMIEIGQRYGRATILRALKELLDRSQAAFSKTLKSLHGHVSYGQTEADFGGQMVPIKVKLEVQDDRLVVDFAGTARQTDSPFNSCLSNTCACVFMALRVTLAGDIPPNAGLYRLVDVRAPEGSIVNPKYPAAISAATQVSYHTFDALMEAFEPLAPHAIYAESGGGGVFSFGGLNPRTDQLFAYGEALGGGSGASPDSEGQSAVMPPVSNLSDTPAEAVELSMPVRIERYELVRTSGGKGFRRGGLGFRRVFRMLAPVRASFQISMGHRAPRGRDGGGNGATTSIRIVRESGQVDVIDSYVEADIAAGDVVWIETAGGGGYGQPVPEASL